jgi:hypothetical protein
MRKTMLIALLQTTSICITAQTEKNLPEMKVKKELVTPRASKEARKLYKTLIKIHKSGKVLSGQMWVPWGIDEIKYVHEVTGKYPAVIGHDLIHEGSNAREMELLTDWYRQGGIPTLMWHWGAPTKGEGYEQSKMTIDITRCFVEGTAEHKAMWADLKRAADWLTVLRDNKVPVLWRPMHEFDGRWFWYGKGGGELFVRLWRTMFHYFANERKLNNLIWVLPHCGQPDTTYNPGREYFDIAGPDTYSEKAQDGLYKKTIEMHGKDILIPLHECGTLPSPEICKSNGTRWSWWMLWHTTHLTGHDKDELRHIYNHEDVITLDEL